MATIYDLIEVSSISPDTTYSEVNGNLLGVVDGMTSAALDDGEFDIGDSVTIGGVSYTISQIQEPSSSGRFTVAGGTELPFDPGLESNLDVVFLTVSNGGDVRHFIIPNDSYGDMDVVSIRTGSLNNVGGSDAAIISTVNDNVNVVCFLGGTLILGANQQQIPVEMLAVGDEVMTADEGQMRVRWIGVQSLSAETLQRHPNLHPVCISTGALGGGLPERDLYVSPQHRMVIRSPIVQRMFGQPEVLVPAKELLAAQGVNAVTCDRPIKYYHILFDRHQIIFAEGAAAESFWDGPVGLQTLPESERIAIREIIPQDHNCPARPLVHGHKARQCIARHIQNAKPFAETPKNPQERPKTPAGYRRSSSPHFFPPVGSSVH